MFKKIVLISISALAILSLARNATAVEPLSTAELSSHCSFYAKETGGPDAIFCVRYIQGFIDGAVATDERVIQNLAKENKEKETFTERAIRTRALRLERDGPTYYADFCLGDESLIKVVEKVVGDLDDKNNKSKHLLAREAVFQTLQKAYPCKKSNMKP